MEETTQTTSDLFEGRKATVKDISRIVHKGKKI